MNLKILKNYDDIIQAFDVFLELRPSLTDAASFATQVLVQQKEGYQVIAVIESDCVVAAIGFRMLTTLAWGKIVYIDDLITKSDQRQKGYAKVLMDHVIGIAKDQECQQIHLDTGPRRHAAHRFYLNKGFELNCYHLALKL